MDNKTIHIPPTITIELDYSNSLVLNFAFLMWAVSSVCENYTTNATSNSADSSNSSNSTDVDKVIPENATGAIEGFFVTVEGFVQDNFDTLIYIMIAVIVGLITVQKMRDKRAITKAESLAKIDGQAERGEG